MWTGIEASGLINGPLPVSPGFCIGDLEVPRISEDWHAILPESYERFKGDFSPRGQL